MVIEVEHFICHIPGAHGSDIAEVFSIGFDAVHSTEPFGCGVAYGCLVKKGGIGGARNDVRLVLKGLEPVEVVVVF